MLAVWGGISHEKEISVTMASQRDTLKGILSKGAFVVSMADVENAVACDFLSIASWNRLARKSATHIATVYNRNKSRDVLPHWRLSVPEIQRAAPFVFVRAKHIFWMHVDRPTVVATDAHVRAVHNQPRLLDGV